MAPSRKQTSKTKQLGNFQENVNILVQCLRGCERISDFVRQLQCAERCTIAFCRRHGVPVLHPGKWNTKKLAIALAKLKKMVAVAKRKARTSQLSQNAQRYIQNLETLVTCINTSTTQEQIVSCFSDFCQNEQSRLGQFGRLSVRRTS